MYPTNNENMESGNSTTQLSAGRVASAGKTDTLSPPISSKCNDVNQLTEHINGLFDELVLIRCYSF
jgi:hypothetical protein